MEQNPLRQYFRRPTVYIKLPSGGKGYPPGTIDIPPTEELPIFPMTAIDEITANTPDALFNGTAMIELIKSCVPNIKDPWKISSSDLDAILIGIKAASGNNMLSIESTCPKCKETSSYEVNLVSILAGLKSGNYDAEIEVNDLIFKFRPLTFKEMNEASLKQFEVQKLFANINNIKAEDEKIKVSERALRELTDLTMKILAQAVEYVKTPTLLVTETEFIYDFLKNCDRKTYTSIREANTNLKAQAELKPLDTKCINCGHEYKQAFTLNISDFFE